MFSSLSQDDDSSCSIDHSSHDFNNKRFDIESFNHVESLDKHCSNLIVVMHSNDCPSFMDESLVSQEDLDFHSFQLESDLIIDDFILGISIPAREDDMSIIEAFF